MPMVNASLPSADLAHARARARPTATGAFPPDRDLPTRASQAGGRAGPGRAPCTPPRHPTRPPRRASCACVP
ncbi:hypothetical protein ZWY2020_017404 [Hordeum vulgare]|nr:hypothetical protein ZWY2020_017404 [Hordeum vulgare]